jgi:sirohydrochlorin cobaltochelatase
VIRDLNQALSQWFDDSTPLRIGEILIQRHADGFEVVHVEDSDRRDLLLYTRPEDARLLSTLDDRETYRPLKSAPNLRHGWRLIVPDLDGLRKALDFFYPAAAGIFLDWQTGSLAAVDLRDTLGRQSGMYAVARKVTDEQAQAMIGEFCESGRGCLKTILWRISRDAPIRSLPAEKFNPHPCGDGNPFRTIPLLCQEACNLLVAKAREVVKAATPAK